MKIETQIQDDHQALITVELEPDVLEGAKRRTARKLANRIKVPGFRPGKAPYPVILKQVGENAILEEAFNLVVDDVYPQVLKESEVQPYAPGKLDNIGSLEDIASMSPLVLKFLVPLKPEVILGDYRSISHPYEKPQVDENDIDRTLENLRDQQAIIEPVERPAQVGDLVSIRISGERKNVDEGQSLTVFSDRSISILVGEDDANGWPYPGFSKELIGLEAAKEKLLEYTYPQDSPVENLRGVETIFRFVVENVKSRSLPELNDEFAASLGEFESLEALRTEIRSSLEVQSLQGYNDGYDEEILKEATDQATVKYPPQMVEHEIDEIIDNLKSRLERQKMDIDLYLKTRQMDMDALRKEAQPAAETRLKRSLVLVEIAKAENIQLDPGEVQSETLNTMNALSGMLPQKEAKRLSEKSVMQNLMSNVMSDMLMRKATERLRLIASGKFEEQPSDDVAETPTPQPEGVTIDSGNTPNAKGTEIPDQQAD